MLEDGAHKSLGLPQSEHLYFSVSVYTMHHHAHLILCSTKTRDRGNSCSCCSLQYFVPLSFEAFLFGNQKNFNKIKEKELGNQDEKKTTQIILLV